MEPELGVREEGRVFLQFQDLLQCYIKSETLEKFSFLTK
jgi:hypothetical protein